MKDETLIIEARELTKVFRDFWGRAKVRAVNGINLEVRRGEIFGLLGPNGSGKSTTLKMLLGLLYPTSGQLTVLGLPPRDVAVKSRMGFMPEESYLYKYLTADEILNFYANLHGLTGQAKKDRVEALIQQVGLAGARNRPVGGGHPRVPFPLHHRGRRSPEGPFHPGVFRQCPQPGRWEISEGHRNHPKGTGRQWNFGYAIPFPLGPELPMPR